MLLERSVFLCYCCRLRNFCWPHLAYTRATQFCRSSSTQGLTSKSSWISSSVWSPCEFSPVTFLYFYNELQSCHSAGGLKAKLNGVVLGVLQSVLPSGEEYGPQRIEMLGEKNEAFNWWWLTFQWNIVLREQEKNWPCYECNRRFMSSEQLQQHLNSHDEKLDFFSRYWELYLCLYITAVLRKICRRKAFCPTDLTNQLGDTWENGSAPEGENMAPGSWLV